MKEIKIAILGLFLFSCVLLNGIDCSENVTKTLVSSNKLDDVLANRQGVLNINSINSVGGIIFSLVLFCALFGIQIRKVLEQVKLWWLLVAYTCVKTAFVCYQSMNQENTSIHESLIFEQLKPIGFFTIYTLILLYITQFTFIQLTKTKSMGLFETIKETHRYTMSLNVASLLPTSLGVKKTQPPPPPPITEHESEVISSHSSCECSVDEGDDRDIESSGDTLPVTIKVDFEYEASKRKSKIQQPSFIPLKKTVIRKEKDGKKEGSQVPLENLSSHEEETEEEIKERIPDILKEFEGDLKQKKVWDNLLESLSDYTKQNIQARCISVTDKNILTFVRAFPFKIINEAFSKITETDIKEFFEWDGTGKTKAKKLLLERYFKGELSRTMSVIFTLIFSKITVFEGIEQLKLRLEKTLSLWRSYFLDNIILRKQREVEVFSQEDFINFITASGEIPFNYRTGQYLSFMARFIFKYGGINQIKSLTLFCQDKIMNKFYELMEASREMDLKQINTELITQLSMKRHPFVQSLFNSVWSHTIIKNRSVPQFIKDMNRIKKILIKIGDKDFDYDMVTYLLTSDELRQRERNTTQSIIRPFKSQEDVGKEFSGILLRNQNMNERQGIRDMMFLAYHDKFSRFLKTLMQIYGLKLEGSLIDKPPYIRSILLLSSKDYLLRLSQHDGPNEFLLRYIHYMFESEINHRSSNLETWGGLLAHLKETLKAWSTHLFSLCLRVNQGVGVIYNFDEYLELKWILEGVGGFYRTTGWFKYDMGHFEELAKFILQRPELTFANEVIALKSLGPPYYHGFDAILSSYLHFEMDQYIYQALKQKLQEKFFTLSFFWGLFFDSFVELYRPKGGSQSFVHDIQRDMKAKYEEMMKIIDRLSQQQQE